MTDSRLTRHARGALLAVGATCAPVAISFGQAAPPCDSNPAYHVLDFWIGDWEVVARDQVVGHDRIDRVVDGCALIENWVARNGSEGKSLFYYDRQEWKQVWVAPGRIKEKHLIGRYADGSVRFQGDLPSAGGAIVLDRTTLTPQRDGTVRQVIETSSDGGTTWSTDFDAIYRRRTSPPRATPDGPQALTLP